MVQFPEHGMLGVPNRVGKEMLKPALEGFANGTFVRKIDAIRFLQSKGMWTKQKPEKYIDKFTEKLKDPYYPGLIEFPAWEVGRRKGHHEPIISLETYELNQKRLRKTDLNKRIRMDISSDFPHRGLIICRDCNGHLTGAWFPNGKGQRYRRYVCRNVACPSYNKVIKAEEIENKFMEILKQGVLKKEVDVLLKRTFDTVWTHEVKKMQDDKQVIEAQKKSLEQKLSEITDLMLASKSAAVRRAYEKQIENTEKEIEELEGQSMPELDLKVPYQTALEKAALLLKKPYIAWDKFDVFEKQKLFFFLFQAKLPYSRKFGYQTSQIPYAARLFEEFVAETTHLVEMPGVKPGSKTYSLFNYSQD